MSEKMIDLERAAMDIGPLNRKNRWRASVESCLIKDSRSWAFLAKDCRAELVGNYDRLTSRGYYEISLINSWRGNFLIRSGAGAFHPFSKSFDSSRRLQAFEGEVDVHAPQRAIRVLEFDQLLAILRKEDTPDDGIYMSVRYEMNGSHYEILCPCRYLNYNNRTEKGGGNYIQPISGYILVEMGKHFFVSYILTHIEDGQIFTTEILYRGPIYLFHLLRKRSLAYYPLGLALLPFKRWLMLDEFAHVHQIKPSSVLFFKYA